MDYARLSAIAAPATRGVAFVLAVVFVFLVLRRSSKTDAAAGGEHDRAVVSDCSIVGVVPGGQDHNILTQVALSC